MDQLSQLFHPASIAIIGISRKTPSLGRMILSNLEDSNYNGKIFLVNPSATEIETHRVYNEIETIPGGIDLAIILTPPRFVPQTLKQLAGRCKFVSIITAGFDQELSDEILAFAHQNSMRIIGPNSMGTYAHNISASFSPIPITPGSLGYISQSGSIIAVVQELMVGAFGFSKFISLGNKIDITEIDVLPYLASDESTKVIAGYLESFSEPAKLRQLLMKITPKKPVILVKGGRTNEGSQAVTSHTGALAGNYRLTNSMLKYCGVMVVKTMEKQIALARFIDRFGVLPHTGIITVSSAGGPGVLAADEIVEAGLTLASLEPDTVRQLHDVIPPFGNPHNPLDLVADAGIDRYVDTINIIRHDPNVSTILVIIVNPVLIDTEPLLEALDRLNLPIIISYLGPNYASFDHYQNLIVYQSTKEVIDILAMINNYDSWKSNAQSYQDVSHMSKSELLSTDEEKSPLGNVENLLQSYGFIYPDTLTTNEYNEAKIWFEQNNQPVVLKLNHSQFSHKTDSGGVLLDISTSQEISDAWNKLQAIYDTTSIAEEERKIEIQPFYSDGLEVVLGIIRDEQFGHFLLIGTGGTLVELMDDTVFLPSPVSKIGVLNAIKNLKLYRLLTGYRGGASVDIDALVDQILKLDKIVYDHPEIRELDINPLYVIPGTSEFIVLDARIEVDSAINLNLVQQ